MKDKETKDEGRDVFISYGSDKIDLAELGDGQAADIVCSALESRGIRCWIAPRDILGGAAWVKEINAALSKARVMVLVFTSSADNSNYVQSEVLLAMERNIPIIPIQIGDVSPGGDLKFLLANRQWIYAHMPPQEKELEHLIDAVSNYLEKEPKTSEKGKVKEQTEAPKEKMPEVIKSVKPIETPNRKWILAAAAIIVLVAIGIIFIDQITKKNGPPKTVQKTEKTEEPKKVQDKSGEIPEDVRNIIAKIGEDKVKKTNKGLWEANYGDGIIMVYIEAGKFTMGSNDYKDEKPIHTVILDGYWIGKTEVTVGQFRQFVEDKGYKTDAEKSGGAYTWTGKDWEKKKDINWKNPGFKQDDNHPVVCVSWNDAKAYCDWLSTEKDLPFKLPTEAQWEKAARGTTKSKYPWGNNEPDNTLANFKWMVGKTSPVDSYSGGASPYGLLNMAGNVWEWCYDWYDSGYYNKSPDRNPTGPDSGSNRVVRGGGWLVDAGYLRCADRAVVRPSDRGPNLGFRLSQDNR